DNPWRTIAARRAVALRPSVEYTSVWAHSCQPRRLGDEHVTSPGASSTVPQIARGLEGVVAAATEIAEVDGEQGRLTFRGYDIRELAGRTTFEEVAYLLWHGRLPIRAEYRGLQDEMSGARELPAAALTALRNLAPHTGG